MEFLKLVLSNELGQLATAGGFVAFLIYLWFNERKERREITKRYNDLMQQVIQEKHDDVLRISNIISTLKTAIEITRGA